MAAAIIAVRRNQRQGGTLGGGSEGPQALYTLGESSFSYSDKTKSMEEEKEFEQIWKQSHQKFPHNKDIVKDLELGILVGRNVFQF